MNMKKLVKKLKLAAMDTKLFWRVYFWWSIRQARKERISRGYDLINPHKKYDPNTIKISIDEYWENKKNGT